MATYDADEIQRFHNAVEAINALAPSVIVDYFLDFVGGLSDSNVLGDYLAALSERQKAAEFAVLEYRSKDEQEKKPQGILNRLRSLFTKN